MSPGFNGGEAGPHKLLSSVRHQVLAALNHLDLSAHIYIEDAKIVGAGAFGDVLKGQCTLPGRASTMVAIKRLRFHKKNDLKSLFEREIYVWAKLSHTNVLPLLGYAFDKSGYPLLVSEWMVNGSAWDYTLNNAECNLLKLAAGISEGLKYIHQMGVIHSDIKPANIVVSESGEARICDFGSSRMVSAVASRSLAKSNTKIQGTPHYLSYELVALPNQGHTKESDVWAFGMTIFALLGHQHPYAQAPKEHLPAVIASRKLPVFPLPESSWTSSRLETRDIFWSVCQMCWDFNPSTRADMTLITSILRDPRTHDSIFRTNQLSKEGALNECLHDLLATLESISKVIDDVSAIHQNLKSASQAAATLAKNVSESIKSDKKVVDLFRNILKAFEFVGAGSVLRRNLRLLEEPVANVLQKAEASFYLVLEHNTPGRILDTYESERLNELIYNLLGYTKECDSILSRHEEVVRIRESQEINIKLLRELLTPNESYDYDRPICLENTRVEVRREVIDWINAKTSPNVLWLQGVAGSGKSTVSRTIAEYFRSISQLGTFIFFEREKSDPSSVIPTIAFKLAMFDSSIGAQIVDQVKMDKDILSAKPAAQFEKLLLQPVMSSGTSTHEPVLVIIDALDECGTPERRQGLVNVLQKELSRLPPNFRFLITSRSEMDIAKVFLLQPSLIRSIELDCNSDASHADVLYYIRFELSKLVTDGMQIPEGWAWDANIVLLGNAASGLFVWASTAVRLVASSDNRFRTLDGLVRDTRSLGRFGLDELYATVLRASGIPWGKKESKSRFSRILGIIILGKAPFTIADMDAFLGFKAVSSSRLVLRRFQSLISYTSSGPVRLFHVSFADYLLSSERFTDPWAIDISNERAFHTMQCFAIMRRELHFNICNLSSSFLHNDAVPGLPDRIRGKILGHLRYACRFWAQHLCEVPFDQGLVTELSNLLYQNLLQWLEVLSLLKDTNIAGSALLATTKWIGINEKEIVAFIRDARRLINIFALPISQSVPHIYISMLPLMTEESKVSAHYAQHTSSMVCVTRMEVKHQSSLLKLLEGHTADVNFVGFSPDGSFIISTSEDETIRIWDAERGVLAASPFYGDVGCIRSTDYSTDGKLIVVGGDRGIAVLDAESGNIIVGPFGEKYIQSVAVSPGGKQIIYLPSKSNLIKMWDLESGVIVGEPFVGHTDVVQCIAYSRDGRFIVSGSSDRSVCVWDVENRRLIREPLVGHDGRVDTVTISPDGKYVVSGSDDTTIRIWDLEKGEVDYSPLTGHEDSITCVAYSSDGTQIVSGSLRSVRIWNAQNGHFVAGPFIGHIDSISCVAFSPDGTRVVSGSYDANLRIWDAERGIIDIDSRAELVRDIEAITFSLDGTCVISDSGTTWRIEDGKIVSEGSSEDFVEGQALEITDSMQFSFHDTLEWNPYTGKVTSSSNGNEDYPECIAVSPNGKKFAFGSLNGSIRVWDGERDMLVCGPFDGLDTFVLSLTFSPDGRHFASGSSDVVVRDTETGELLFGPFGHPHTDLIFSIIYSPDGRYITSGSLDGTLRVWDIEMGCATIFEGHTGGVDSIAYSLDGSHIASSFLDNSIKIWNINASKAFASIDQDQDRQLAPNHDRDLSMWTLDKDGWIHGVHDELLLWVPPDLCPTLITPLRVAIMNVEFTTKLDFSDAALGERWHECFHPLE